MAPFLLCGPMIYNLQSLVTFLMNHTQVHSFYILMLHSLTYYFLATEKELDFFFQLLAMSLLIEVKQFDLQ